MGHNYEEAKKFVYKGLVILAVVTLIEVFVSLFGKGHLGYNPAEGPFNITLFGYTFNWLLGLLALAIVALSIYKAKFIIYEFMHMAHEMPGLAKTVLLPTALLIWAIIAFFAEGNYWNNSRAKIIDKNKAPVEAQNDSSIGMDIRQLEQKDFD